ncbi:VanZ family protein [Clostridium perfringens]|uniref:VanZ family protein n=2 Tax=Clostridium perfringens TaxID=1502 RepID=UPI001CCE66F2|nr:VanZ family protein [Clostridium perfringens]MDH5085824.1 VanZ like family protein [Clostridium perfringens]UBK69545.1 VanZ family protein [Clostridium perfringens]
MMAAVYTPRLLILYGTILLLFSIVIRISFYKLKRKKINIKKELLVNLFVFYLICLISITLLPITIYYIKAPYIITPNINFVPFYGILDYTSSKILLFNTLGNLILFVPFMIFIEILKDGKISLLKGLFLILICSLLIEGIQYIEMYFQLAERIVDINDVILNTLGGGIGYYIYISLFKNFTIHKNSKT